MVAVTFPLSSSPGRNTQESAGRLINCFAIPQPEGSRWPAKWHRVPGLASFGTTSQTGFRGMVQVESTLFAIYAVRAMSFTSAGGAGTIEGNIAGTAKVFIAVNNNSPRNTVIVDPDEGAFNIAANGDVTSFADADLPQPADVCFLKGYFFFAIANGRCFASGINAVTIDATHFTTAESKSDTLKRVIPWQGQLLMFGAGSIEVWTGDQVNDTGFPFNYLTTIQRGLAGRYAIAGHQDGFGKALIFVGDDNAVYMLNGYTPEKISPPDLDALIEAVADKDDLEAGCYVSQGRSIWALSCDDWTWEFNLNSLKWNERESYLIDRWRGMTPYYAFGKWLVGDTESGNIYQIDADTRQEAGNPLRMRMESANVHKFPNRVMISRVDIDVVVGVGIADGTQPDQTEPTIEVSCARHGDQWDPPRLLKLGPQAREDQRVYATRFGVSGPQGPRFRIDISDPVFAPVMGMTAEPALRQA